MKKILVSLLATAFIGGAFAQSSFPDVPDNHWAGDAVDRIADLGIVIGFPDGTFRGNEAFTRYQAALVVTRLLDVIGAELDARQALTDADLAALAAAIQALEAELAAQGARLGSAEDAIASVADGVAVNSARLDALEALLAGGLDTEALADLANQLAALRVGVDTALAQAQAAEDLARDALSAARAAQARANQNAAAIDALSWLNNDLEGRVSALEGRAAGDPSLAGRLAAVENDIANIREFAILLRRDQVALRNQVAGLSDTVDQHSEDIADLQARVTELERNAISFSGSITVSYRIDRLSGAGNQFDVDRAYGVGMPRAMGSGSTFTTGARNTDEEPGNANAQNRPAEHNADIGARFRAPINAALTLNVTFNRVFDGSGSPNALNDFDAVVDLYLRPATNLVAPNGATFTGYVFGVREFSGTFHGIGGAPLTFSFGEEISVAFTPYVFRFDEWQGFVATLQNPLGFLDFLSPTLTAAYVSPADTAADITVQYRAARLTVSPFAGVTIGGSFAQAAENTIDKDNVLVDNLWSTVWGVDASASISIFSLSGEFAMADKLDDNTGTATSFDPLYYVQLGIDTANIPVLNSLSANYRNIPETWVHSAGNPASVPGLVDSNSAYPFVADQTGFGVNASLSLWIVDITAYFDSYTTSISPDNVMAFGVDVSAEIFRAISASAFFRMASVGGETVDSTQANRIYDSNDNAHAVNAAGLSRDRHYTTGFGVGIVHNGAADNALVSNLNFNAGYEQHEADFARTVIYAGADYRLNVAFLTFTPYADFRMERSPLSPRPPYNQFNLTRIRAGTGIQTEAFDFFLRPSLVGAVNWRQSTYADRNALGAGGVDSYVASEFQFSVGVTFNEFLFDNSVLTVRYASWTGTNVGSSVVPHTQGFRGDTASRIHVGDEVPAAGDVTQFVNGWEAIWDYWDLQFAYGVYLSDEGPGRLTAGQVFRIRYTVTF